MSSARLQPDAARQPLRAARAGDEAELHLGEREHRLRVVGRDAIARRRAPISSPPPRHAPWIAATTGMRQRSSRSSQRLPAARQRLGVGAPCARARNCVDVGAGDATCRACPTSARRRAIGRVVLEPVEQRGENASSARRGRALFTGSPGRSMRRRRATPSTTCQRERGVQQLHRSRALHDHRVAHAAGRAHGQHAELPAAPRSSLQSVVRMRAAGGAERMADGDASRP